MIRKVLMLLVVLVFYAYGVVLQVLPSIIAFDLMRDYGASALALGVLVFVGNTSIGASQLISGSLLDQFGARRVVSVSIFLTALGTLCFGLAGSFHFLLLSRVLMLIGCGGSWVSIALIAMHWFSSRSFVFIMAVAQTAYTVGAILGEWMFAYILEFVSWHQLHLYLAIIGGLLTVLASFLIKDAKQEAMERKDRVNLLTGLMIIMRKRDSWYLVYYTIATWVPMIVFSSFWGIPFLTLKLEVSTTKAASLVALTWVGYGIGNLLLGYLARFVANRSLFLIFGSLVGVISSLCLLWQAQLGLMGARVYLFLLGMACSTNIFVYALIRGIVPKSVSALSQAFLNIFPGIVGVVLSPLVGVILTLYGSVGTQGDLPLYSVEVFRDILTVIPLLFALGFYVAYFHIYKIARLKI